MKRDTLANRSNIKRLSISTTFWNRCFSISFLLLKGCALGGPQSIVGFIVLICDENNGIDVYINCRGIFTKKKG